MYVESICPGGLLGLLYKTQDTVWGFFEKLAWDTYVFEQAKEAPGYPSHGDYAFHSNPHHRVDVTDSYDNPSYSYVHHVLCN